jgi:glycosyltransferase involved in cell wall biosynthesis
VRVLIVHNRYQQPGGEDAVARDEAELLRRNQVAVEVYERSNDELRGMTQVQAFAQALWSRRTVRELGDRMCRFRPDVVHVHNAFPLISPSVYYIASRHGIPVVQTLHNFRLLCAQGMLLREEAVCEKCVGTFPWRGVVHRCYRNSLPHSVALVSMTATHRLFGSSRQVTRFIAPTAFVRDKFVAAGLPSDRISVKPNFVDLPPPSLMERRGALFVGRLSPEKGIEVLRKAASACVGGSIEVIGSGPLQRSLEDAAGVRLRGWQSPNSIHARMRTAEYLVMPSIWYETFGRVVAEAYACGLPVIASRLGAMAELVHHGETGLLFRAGDSEDLRRTLIWANQHPAEMRRMGMEARREYERRYTPQINFSQLLAIYRQAIAAEGVRH